ncbi:C40 family peptidase [Sphaerisporangium perillae]|uniref:C40 family peptidase n=1 Tax=Sphaerisporangium perillae TaxID=2935860 RepID=UPI00200F0455|nr:C40 family peptidase [Sphaerisporangium perillae]
MPRDVRRRAAAVAIVLACGLVGTSECAAWALTGAHPAATAYWSPGSWAAWSGRPVTGGRLGDRAANWALTQLGKPYVWAAAGPRGYDCSGLTMRAWQRVGVPLPHWTGTQWTSGRRVPLASLRRGDLLFFGRRTRDPGTIAHVGIYIGGGQMVHAPKRGDVVRIASIWRPNMVGVVRPKNRVAT